MDEVVKAVVDAVNNAERRLVIAISGHGAAGKTTFSNQLLKAFGKENVSYLNTDAYIISSALRKYTTIEYAHENTIHRSKLTACHPSAHHVLSLERDIKMLREGMELYTIDMPYAKSELLTPKPITIVEGMSAAFADPALFDLSIYFYTDDETELVRRYGRDITERGADRNYLRRSHEVRRIQYRLFMHSYSYNFDIVVKSSNEAVKIEKNTLTEMAVTKIQDEIGPVD